MTASVLLPAAKDVKDMLSRLLGKNVGVLPGAPVTPTPQAPVALAVFVSPALSTTAICVLDLAAAAYTAGALALLPPGGCQDAVEEDGELTPLLVEALHEVVNVLSAVLNTPGAPHSRLDRLYAPGEDLPGDVVGLLPSLNRLDVAVDVPGYGRGGMSVVVA